MKRMVSSRVRPGIRVVPAVLVALWCVLVARSATAQSTLFNIPSTDTVAPSKVYVEFDFLPQAPGADDGASLHLQPPCPRRPAARRGSRRQFSHLSQQRLR